MASAARSYGLINPKGWERPSLQLSGAVALGAILPFFVAVILQPRLTHMGLFYNSVVASLLAIVAGYYLFRCLIAFPGIRVSYYILPAFSSAFGVAFVLLMMFRLEYSRPLLIASYMICVSWYYIVYFQRQKQPDLVIGVVPFGNMSLLDRIDWVTWERLDVPRNRPQRFSAIVADFHADMPESWQSFLADAALSGIPVLHVKQLCESLTGRVEIAHLSENAHGSLAPHAAYRVPKCVVDTVIAAVALILLTPLFLAVSLAVKLSSPGPIFFQQQRVGYRGESFRVWKFRTMAHRQTPTDGDFSDAARDEAITRENDMRITRVGRFLRRSRIDELPQLINVILGQMSFIGPRPEAAVLARWYQQEIPFYRYRHIVRPGITGWAQVNQGHVADVQSVHSKLHYDFYYISNFSLWLDVLIVLRTVRTVVTGFGHK